MVIMDSSNPATIAYGQYVIFQRKEYNKLHLLSEKTSSLFMGKDKIELDAIFGEKLGSTFKIVPKVGCNRQFTLQLCDTSNVSCGKESLKELGIGSGLDNRSIRDDGSSQSLTSGNIELLRDKGIAPKVIIEQLVENSKTFHIKTEFSQEKYIKKKEKKYFEFITIKSPSIRLISEIFYNRDLPKSVGIRSDTISQISTTLNLQPNGNYILVENGFSGMVAATLLNYLSSNGKLIHITPGNQNQKQAVLAMNFSSDQMSRLTTIRLSTMLELIDQAQPTNKILVDNITPAAPETSVTSLPLAIETNNHTKSNERCSLDEENKTNSSSSPEPRKRKHSEENISTSNTESGGKKPRWALEAELAVEVIQKKVDGLVIVCKEYPTNILNKLLTYLLPSRPFVVYSLYQEPLVALYLQLKQRHDIVYLRITETWLRPYQVLPERTHPFVTVSSSSGYLLSGVKVLNK
ncbi:tRNA (adenine(58)-N(1))-methyltransferase non-catalytic subunit TRM6 [Macrosteles quadrilineatus]|uniref:tRNA (adenine(58)-N(1))-methyltransferase non-catalytic subunit TRM6 n=1 Tax=Macrosteles quadrilineatus TaxID=74068 RepID=UPI0023E0FA77|nr:tRNA (adenine(58)-N(1))-methyltransferase non-catalytic subunit TRM6 [Macrosteles quadrilineatus]